jgi:uncharacterized protein (TIGR03086 family)
VTPLLTGGAELLERAISYTLGSLRLVTPVVLRDPTPCQGWDLRALLTHMNDSLAALHEAVDSGHVALTATTGEPADDLVAELKDRACHLLGAWSATGRERVMIADRELTGLIVGCAGALEIAVHGWDVARACGQERPIPDELADQLLGLAGILVSDADRPGRFGPRAGTRPGATAGDQLVAFLGRHP